MQSMNIYRSLIVPVNYDLPDNSRFIRRLRPMVYRQGDEYCCMIGSDQQGTIFGRGAAPGIAIKNWEDNLVRRLEHIEDEDDITKIARRRLISNKVYS